ncbi:MAG TPA: endolytic transglycosylase MltG, partial [Acidimicrobiales bacterium]|nr:endolytic transglycosylase MltG [Acidimicrobiales bacterium]
AALGISPYQAITVASIVQKEGVYPENLGKVSRVVYNRLARGKPLQMDSTVLYSEHRDGGPVTPADLALNTPYNTYLHDGLTPTPIAFPSQGALRAALHPTPGDWLYFVVVTKDGTEAFSDTLAGQLANERLAQSRGLG